MRRALLHLICYLGVSACASSLLNAQTVTESAIYNFVAGPAGEHPENGLIQASDGNFYGTVSDVYGFGYGSVYRITPSGDFSVVYTFTNGLDGGEPEASLIEGPDGALYGTTSQGGSGYQAGTVFRLTLDGQLTTMFQFNGDATGMAPDSTLTLGSDGNFYGVLTSGGPQYTGEVFKLTLKGQYSNLFDFVDSNFYLYPAGEYPQSPLLEYTPGMFLGTTEAGGSGDEAGTVFTISSTGAFQQVYGFTNGDGPSGPVGFLTIASDGSAYGVTNLGPLTQTGDGGVIFQISPDGSYQTIHVMDVLPEGSQLSGVTLGSDGRLYSATYSGGTNETGTIIASTTSGNLKVVHNFSAINDLGSSAGWNPISPPIQGSDGAFYGTASDGGTNLQGAIYRLAFNPALPPPVQLQLSSASVAAGEPVQLSWQVSNAFSITMQQCYAFVQSNYSGAGNWTGLQKGAISDGSYQGSATVIPTASGTFTYALTCGGVESGFATLTVTGDAEKSSSTSLHVTPNLVAHDAKIQFSVAVAGSGGTPTGDVAFTAGGITLATAPLKNGSIAGAFPTNGYPTGTYQVTANYLGDANFSPSTSLPVTVQLLPALAATTTVLYDEYTFEGPLGGEMNTPAQVLSTLENSSPTGTVNYYIQGKNVGSAPLSPMGYVEGRINLAGFSAGTYLLNATYLGDSDDAPSSAIPVVLYIGVTPDETFLSVSPYTVTAPATETLTARVYNDNDDTFPVSGTVVFTTGNITVGSAQVNSTGYATLTFSTKGIPPGAYPVVATFQGNSTFGQSSSPAQTVTVR